MPRSPRILVVPAMCLVAALIAGWAFSGISGVEPPRTPEVRPAPQGAAVWPAPAEAPPAEAASRPPLRRLPADLPRIEQPGPARPGGPLAGPGLDARPALDDAERAARVQEATVQATSRRVEMMHRMFQAAPLVVGEEGDRADVQNILGDAIERMGELEGRVVSGELSYRDAVQGMDAIRDEAAAAIDDLLPQVDADAVKLRMGVRPAPPPADRVLDWRGESFEEHFGPDWE